MGLKAGVSPVGGAMAATPAPQAATAAAPPAQQPLPGVDVGAIVSGATQKYGFLKNNSVQAIVNLKQGEGYAETWPASEPGAPDWPRPKNLPMGTNGVEIKAKDFGPEDYAAEVFSHVDPVGIKAADAFTRSLSKDQIAKLKAESRDYEMSKKMGMSEDLALRNAGMAAVRGYVFGQWPEAAFKSIGLTGQQKAGLEKAKSYAINGK